MKTLKNWVLNHQAADHVELKVDDQHLFRIYVLESGLFRVLIKQRGELALNRTWSIAPQADVPWEGRDRESTEGFTLPAFELEQTDNGLRISTDRMRV
ncbi:MAG: alpha-glucosidase domain-containing protein, partial [Hafnia sp.]